MIFTKTKLDGAWIIEPERVEDERGFFARTFCQKEFEAQGLNSQLVQCSISFNKKKGILRGMHSQARPYEEAKLVRCTRGAIYDVVLDVRPGSATYKEWVAVELTAENRLALYIGKGFAHGFQTLEPNTEVYYQMSEFYHPECARGVRWNDPACQIKWPLESVIISEKDRNYPDLDQRVIG
ncbi:MAG: dTDP-4-dehydrorhamnose 3,5-epimerase [Terriglobia bacterium]